MHLIFPVYKVWICCCDLVIVESTYGVRNHLPRTEREQNFLKKVRGILDRGGNVLLPVVALGRAQVMHQQACLCQYFISRLFLWCRLAHPV